MVDGSGFTNADSHSHERVVSGGGGAIVLRLIMLSKGGTQKHPKGNEALEGACDQDHVVWSSMVKRTLSPRHSTCEYRERLAIGFEAGVELAVVVVGGWRVSDAGRTVAGWQVRTCQATRPGPLARVADTLP